MDLSLKKVKLPIEKFNSTIRIQIDHLKANKQNILRLVQQKENGSYDKIKREELNAIRTIKQIKNQIVEINEVRDQLPEDERQKFESQISVKNEALNEIQSFLAMELKPPDKTEYLEDNDDICNEDDLPPITTCFALDDYQLKARAAFLQDVIQIEKDIQDMFGVFKQVQDMVHEQAEPIKCVAENVESTEISIQKGNQHLKQALKYQKAAYPLLGAVIGTCLAGPLGLIMGAKTGGLLALGGGVLGYTSGKVLKKEEASGQSQNESRVDEALPAIE